MLCIDPIWCQEKARLGYEQNGESVAAPVSAELVSREEKPLRILTLKPMRQSNAIRKYEFVLVSKSRPGRDLELLGKLSHRKTLLVWEKVESSGLTVAPGAARTALWGGVEKTFRFIYDGI